MGLGSYEGYSDDGEDLRGMDLDRFRPLSYGGETTDTPHADMHTDDPWRASAPLDGTGTGAGAGAAPKNPNSDTSKFCSD